MNFHCVTEMSLAAPPSTISLLLPRPLWLPVYQKEMMCVEELGSVTQVTTWLLAFVNSLRSHPLYRFRRAFC